MCLEWGKTGFGIRNSILSVWIHGISKWDLYLVGFGLIKWNGFQIEEISWDMNYGQYKNQVLNINFVYITHKF